MAGGSRERREEGVCRDRERGKKGILGKKWCVERNFGKIMDVEGEALVVPLAALYNSITRVV